MGIAPKYWSVLDHVSDCIPVEDFSWLRGRRHDMSFNVCLKQSRDFIGEIFQAVPDYIYRDGVSSSTSFLIVWAFDNQCVQRLGVRFGEKVDAAFCSAEVWILSKD